MATSEIPKPSPLPTVSESSWYKRFPNGGTAYVRSPPSPPDISHNKSNLFRRMPNGGGTVYQSPERAGDDAAK